MKFATFCLLPIFLVGCTTPQDSRETDPIKLLSGNPKPYSPFWEVRFPGTILIQEANGIDMLSDHRWLNTLEGVPDNSPLAKLWDTTAPPSATNAGSNLMTAVESGKISSSFVASLNASFTTNATGIIRGLRAQSADYSFGFESYLTPKGRSAVSAFNQWKANTNYPDFKKSLVQAIGDRKGDIFIVNRIKYIPIGSYTLTFNTTIDANAAAAVAKTLNLTSTNQWKIQDNTFTRIASPAVGGFVVQWECRKIQL